MSTPVQPASESQPATAFEVLGWRPAAVSRAKFLAVVSDHAELLKLRVSGLVVLTAWAGYYLGMARSGESSFSWGLLHTLLGIGLVSGGAAALNQVMECDADGRMARTSHRPLPSKRMPLGHALILGSVATVAGSAYLMWSTNLLTGGLALATAVSYLAAYTPLKKVSPLSTLIGAFPGAMPPLLGWTAARGRLEWEALALFAVVFLWQFPHFLSIAWLYCEDYERAGILMLPVLDREGRATSRDIVLYSALLLPVSLLPTLLHVSGKTYFGGAVLLGFGLLWFGVRMARQKLSPRAPRSKKFARQLLQATVIYLPLLFGLMMVNA